MSLLLREKLANVKELYLRIKVRTGLPVSRIKEIMADDTIKIDLAAQPLKGRANQELIKLLASEFIVNKSKISIISGAKERLKLVKIIK